MREKNLCLLGILLIAVSFLLFSDTAFSQTTFKFGGTQQLVPGSSSILKAESITFTVPRTIIEAYGNHDGFWIESNGTVFQQFWYVGDVLQPNPVGFVLPAGTYRVYPNVQKDPKKPNYTNLEANITLTVL